MKTLNDFPAEILPRYWREYEGPSLLCEPHDAVDDPWSGYSDEELEFLDAEFCRKMADPEA